MEAWRNFKGRKWTEEIDVRDFIQNNYTEYSGDESFLADATPATNNFGVDFRNSKKRSVQTAAFLSVRQKSYPVLQHTVRATLTSQ